MGRPLPRIESDTDAGRQAGRQADRQTSRQADRQTGRQADRQAGRQTDRQALGLVRKSVHGRRITGNTAN